MAINNWKLWLVPFAVWGLAMTWYSGYQSGYQDGHETAWRMSRPNVGTAGTEQLALDDAEFLVGFAAK